MDMPAALPAAFSGVNFSAVGDKIADLAGTAAIIKETWDLQTFNDLIAGRVAVPDEAINSFLDQYTDPAGPVRKITVESLADQRIKVTADTKAAGPVVMFGRIEQFIHNKDQSVMQLKVVGKKLPDRPVMSFIFSRITLAWAAKMAGVPTSFDGVNLVLKRNDVTVDFHQALYTSRFGGLELFGWRLLDAVTISEAVPEAGAVKFTTGLDLPDNIIQMVHNILAGREDQ